MENGLSESTERGEAGVDGTDESGEKRSDWGSIMAGIGDRPKTVGF